MTTTTSKISNFQYPYTVNKSIWMDGASDYMSWTQGIGSSQTNVTISFWVKRSKISVWQFLYYTPGDGSHFDYIEFTAKDEIQLHHDDGTYFCKLKTTAKYRDTSSWYHIMVAYDLNNSVDKNTAKLYVNGKRVTDFSTEILTASYSAGFSKWNTTGTVAYLGSLSGSSTFFNGYMAQFAWVDGTTCTPDQFGTFEKGVWVPIDISTEIGSGTNSFLLDFAIDTASSSGIGNDIWNTNDFTPTSFTTANQTEDTPTNNWCTINALDVRTANAPTISEGNLKWTGAGTGYGVSSSTFAVNSGKWVWEAKYVSDTSEISLGIVGVGADFDEAVALETISESVAWKTTGAAYVESGGTQTTWSSGGTTSTTGAYFRFEFDADIGQLAIYINDVLEETITGIDMSKWWTPAVGSDTTATNVVLFNFGQDPEDLATSYAEDNNTGTYGKFQSTPSAGFLSLCSQNLPDPEILQGDEHFDVNLNDGNSTANRVIGNFKFSPAMCLYYDRPGTTQLGIVDKVRGVHNELNPDDNAAEGSITTSITSFNRNSITVGTLASLNGAVDTSQNVWRMDEHVAGMTKGAGTSQPYSGLVNKRAGQAIIGYVGNNTTGHEIPTHLNKPVEFVFIRDRVALSNGNVGHKDLISWTYRLLINSSAGQVSDPTIWDSSPPSSTTVRLGSGGDVNVNTSDFVMYCYHSVPGYSMIGSGEGNGNADGTFHWTGFEIGMLWITDADTSASWQMWDTTNCPINPAAKYQYTDTPTAEQNTVNIDFLSNGFKLRNATLINVDAKTVVWYAVAKHPFKYSNAR